MSGTSLDAVDAALADFGRQPVRVAAFASRPIPQALRDQLAALQASGPDELHRAALAANTLADLYAQTVTDLLQAAGLQPGQIGAIGAHGQTVRHRPDLGYTLQLNNPARLAERTGIAVVADLRSRDIAAGGQGAPLVSAFHARVLSHPTERRAIVNLGGIANVSLIEPAGQNVIGWDCGPGNVLMDGWCERHRGERLDVDGRWAQSGQMQPALLERLLAEPYFALAAPKSTGRDLFHMGWLNTALGASNRPESWTPADVQATLLELTAVTVAQACRSEQPDRILLCGGGAANPVLRRRLAALLAPTEVGLTDDEGIAAQAVEALAFAWLAHEHLCGHAANAPLVTGAAGPRLLGALYPA